MPEASMNKNSDFPAHERNIGSSNHWPIAPITSKAARAKKPSYALFRAGVGALISAHRFANVLVQGLRIFVSD